MKAGTLATAWGGVSSLQVGFRAVLTGAMRRGLSLADVVRWMSCNTARLWDLTIPWRYNAGIAGRFGDYSPVRTVCCGCYRFGKPQSDLRLRWHDA